MIRKLEVEMGNKYDIYQVYRATKEYNNYGGIIPQGMLLQIWRYEGSLISLKGEDKKNYYMQARDLLNTDNFQRVF
jgi:hypothetical protein